MLRKKWFVTLITSLALVLLVAGVVYAQEPGSQPDPGNSPSGAPHKGWRYEDASMLIIVADTLKMPLADLVAALREGTKVADLAEEKEIDLDTLIDAVLAPRAEVLDRFVEAELVKQEQADKILDRMRENLELRFKYPRVARRLQIAERILAARRQAKRPRPPAER